MRSREKILLIIPNLNFGGAQETFSKLSISLSKHHTVYNVVFNKSGMTDYLLGGELYDLNVSASNGYFNKVINFFKRVRRLSSLKRSLDITIAISFLEGADYVNILSRKGEIIISSIRGSKKYDQNIKGVIGWFRHNLLIPLLYNRMDFLVALNYGVKNELQKHYGIRIPIHVIYNGFDMDYIQSLASQEMPEDEKWIFDAPVIISHGRLSIEKGYDFLVRVFREVLNTTGCRLVIIGDGPEKGNSLETMSRIKFVNIR